MSNVNWINLKNEYINGNISYRKLAEKYNVSFNTLKDRAVKEKWGVLRDCQYHKITTKTQQKTAEKIAEQESDYIVNVSKINFSLADIINKFIEQKDGYAIFEAKDVKALTGALKDINDIKKSSHDDNYSKIDKPKLVEAIKNMPDVWSDDV